MRSKEAIQGLIYALINESKKEDSFATYYFPVRADEIPVIKALFSMIFYKIEFMEHSDMKEEGGKVKYTVATVWVKPFEPEDKIFVLPHPTVNGKQIKQMDI